MRLTALKRKGPADGDLLLPGIAALVVILLPLSFFTGAFDVFGAIKYSLLILLAIAGLALQARAATTAGRLRLPGGLPGLLLGGFLGWLVLSTFFSGVPLVSLFGARRRYLGLITYLAAAALLASAVQTSWDKAKINAFFYSATFAAIVSGFLGGAQYFGATYPFDLTAQFGRAAYSTFGNPAHFGIFLAMVLPIPLHLTLDGENLREKLIGGVGLAATLTGILSSGSSGAAIGALFSAGLVLIWRYLANGDFKGRIKLVGGALAICLIGGSIYALALEQTAIGQRSWVWSAALRVSANRPITGTGLDSLQSGIRALKTPPEAGSNGQVYDDAHNFQLNLAASAGWPALALGTAFLFFTIKGGLAAWRRRGAHHRALPIFIAAAGGYLAAVQFNPEDIGSMPVFWICLGVILSLSGEIKSIALSNRGRAYIGAGIISLAIPAAVFLAAKPLAAEINLLKANNPPDLNASLVSFRSAQNAQPWQSQYYVMEIYRLLPSLRELNSPLGRELIATARKVTATNPGDPEAWLAFGRIYRAAALLKDDPELHQDALSLFNQAFDLDPYNAQAIRLLAATHSDLGDNQGSLRWIKYHNRFFVEDDGLADLEKRITGKVGSDGAKNR